MHPSFVYVFARIFRNYVDLIDLTGLSSPDASSDSEFDDLPDVSVTLKTAVKRYIMSSSFHYIFKG